MFHTPVIEPAPTRPSNTASKLLALLLPADTEPAVFKTDLFLPINLTINQSYASSKISPDITYSKSPFAEAVNLSKSVSSK